MKIKTALDRLTAFAITRYAHTNRKRAKPEELSDEAFERNRHSVERFLTEAIANGCTDKTFGEIFYNSFSPLSQSHPFTNRNAEDQASWEKTARYFMAEVVAELKREE